MERIYASAEIEGVRIEFSWSEQYKNASIISINVPAKANYVIDAVINYSISEEGITGSFSFREGE